MSDATTELSELRIEKLLLATDWSEHEEELELHARAAALGRLFDAEVVVLTAYDPPAPLRVKRGAPGLDEYRHELAKQAAETAAEVAAQLVEWGVKARAVAAEGNTDDVILQTAEDEGVDLIVIGGSSGSSPSRYLVGSTTERVVRHAAAPVLVFK